MQITNKFLSRTLGIRENAKLKALFVVGLILLLAAPALVISIPVANAHTPAWTIPTYAYLTAAPSPVGQGQPIYLVFWLDKFPPTAAGNDGARWYNFTVEVAKPDGSKATLGPYTSDPVGSYYAIYNPDQTGQYKFTFHWPGQVLTRVGPSGLLGQDSPYINDTYAASTSDPVYVTVQKDPIPNPPSFALPSGYWTRPIEGQNDNWFTIAGSWLGSPAIQNRFQPYSTAPASSHIVWTRPYQFGGVVGGNNAMTPGMNFYSGTQYEGKLGNPIIMYGILFYQAPRSASSGGEGTYAVDLRTGQVIWWKNITVAFGEFYDYESPNQHGTIPNGYLFSTGPYTNYGGFGAGGNYPGSQALSNGMGSTSYMIFDPMTGDWLFNYTGIPMGFSMFGAAPAGTQVYGSNGEILSYILSSDGKTLALWNNTAAQTEVAWYNGTGFWQWRPMGFYYGVVNASQAYSWNVTLPTPVGSGSAIAKAVEGDMILGRTGTLPGSGISTPYTMWAINLNPKKGTIGSLLWKQSYPAPDGNLTVQSILADPESRTFVVYYKETMQWVGYSMDNGQKLWGPTASEVAWNYYQGGGGAVTSTAIAYGRLYSTGYGGVLYCYDLKTGKTLFAYGNGGAGNSTNSGLATLYGNYPLSIGTIADNKVYLHTNEHSANAPPYAGMLIRCVDATTGKELWTTYGWGAVNSFAIADGYMTYLNLYDMQIYCYGKGQTATTVSTQDTVASLGNKVLITGTVMDQSPGRYDMTGFTPGQASPQKPIPAISEDSMRAYMEYQYMQKDIPANATGVLVKLTAIDQNGKSYDLGTTASDMSGVYSIMWTPPAEGKYTIMASFGGSNSYYASYAECALGVGPAAVSVPTSPAPTSTASPGTSPATSTSPTPAQTTSPAATSSPTVAPEPKQGTQTETLLIAGIATIIIIAVVAAALILRKRK